MNAHNRLILAQAERLYGVKPSHEITMGGTNSRVFEVSDGQSAYILRAAQYSPQQKEYIAFQLKWAEYLSGRLSGVVQPKRSRGGNLYEMANQGDQAFILSLLEKAPGKIVDADNPDEFNTQLFFRLGALMGDMHRLTVGYEGNIRDPLFEWTGLPNEWRYNTPVLDDEVRRCQGTYYDKLRALPISRDDYGIIHWDIHTDNFFVDDGNIKIFDFGACQFNWYAADVASAVFFMVLKGAGPLKNKSEKERTEFAEEYLISYLKGYMETNRICEYWVRKIDLFIKYQMCDEYLAGQSFWPAGLADQQAWYLNWHKERITKGLPYVFIDYDKVLGSLTPTGAKPRI